jgi:PAS domain S-box-containing protein
MDDLENLSSPCAEARFQALFELLPDGVVMIDPATVLPVAFNSAAHRQLGYSPEEFARTPILQYEAIETLEQTRARVEHLLQTGRDDFETLHRRKDGTLMDVRVTVLSMNEVGRQYFLCVFRDISEVRRAQDELRIKARLLNEAQRIAGVGSWELDLVTNRLSWSDEIYRMFEIDGARFKASYEAFLDAVHPDDRDRIDHAYQQSLRDRQPYEITHRLRMADGRIKWVHERCYSEFDSEGRPLRSLGTVQDITERHEAQMELQRLNADLERRVDLRTAELRTAKEAAEEANRAKSRFLASMSHELRTPLNAILGYAQLLETEEGLAPAALDSAVEIRQAGNHLLALVNDILDLARIEAGRLEVDLRSVSLRELLSQCYSQNSRAAAEHGIRLEIDASCNEVEVRADPLRLLQVLNNLISNGIKYNCPDGRVGVSCVADTAGGGRAVIAVNDTGPGLTPEQQGQLFQPFNRLGVEMGRIQGSGIGLVITRQLVEAMVGELRVHSRLGEGSTWHVELPLAVAHTTAHTAAEPAQPAATTPRRILVAEDYAPNQAVLRQQLIRLGHAVEMAENGALALECWQVGSYDLIFTDLNMPVMDGLELAQAVRQQERTRGGHIPIIGITAAAVADELGRCRAAGMDDALAKPLTLEGLRSALDRWLRAAGTPPPAVRLETSADADRAVLVPARLYAVLGASDVEQGRALTERFVESAAAGLRQLPTDSNPAALAQELHRQKSAARTVGALRFAALAEELEQQAANGALQDVAAALAPLQAAVDAVKAAAADVFSRPVSTETAIQSASVTVPAALLVDDDPVLLRQMELLLRRLGVGHVETARSAREALERLAAASPPLLVCDLNMPEMDGVEFTRALVQRSYQGGIILLSGVDGRTLQAADRLIRSHGLHLLGSLHKPAGPNDLLPLLERVAPAVPAVPERVRPAGNAYRPEELSNAIAAGQLVNHYQPKINLATGAVHGVETLVRWRHPRDGLVFPDRFIGVAEQHGLIDDLTNVVLSEALRQAGEWRREGLRLRVAVNLSMDNLGVLELPDCIARQAERYGVEPGDLMLEITESRLMRDVRTALDILTRLRLKGIGLSIDDFGTGHSSLSQLRDIPFSQLKVDHSFVTGAWRDATRRVIYEASLSMARQLGMEMVGEGVEAREDWDFLRSSGCHIAQGWFIAKPMSAAALPAWIDDWQERLRADPGLCGG